MASSRTSPRNHHLKLIIGAPLLVLSIGLHGLVLSLPMPAGWEEAEDASEAAETAPESVAVVPIPREAWLGSPRATPSAQPPKAAVVRPTAPTPPTDPSSSTAAAPAAPTAAVDQAEEQIEEQTEEQAVLPEDPGILLTPEAPPTLAELLQDPSSYTYNNSVKAAAGATSDYMDWYFKTLDEVGGTLASGTPNLAPLRIPYLSTTCLDPAPAEGRLGVVVDDKGAVSQPPYVLSSTGYSILDEQAQAVILANEYTFPPSSSTTAYGLPVLVEYDAATCVPPQP